MVDPSSMNTVWESPSSVVQAKCHRWSERLGLWAPKGDWRLAGDKGRLAGMSRAVAARAATGAETGATGQGALGDGGLGV